MINLHELLPEKVSDEVAYHLVEIFVNFASALDSYYFSQIKRHIDNAKMDDPLLRLFHSKLE